MSPTTGPTDEIVYVDTSTPGGPTTSLEVLVGQTPPEGLTRHPKTVTAFEPPPTSGSGPTNWIGFWVQAFTADAGPSSTTIPFEQEYLGDTTQDPAFEYTLNPEDEPTGSIQIPPGTYLQTIRGVLQIGSSAIDDGLEIAQLYLDRVGGTSLYDATQVGFVPANTETTVFTARATDIVVAPANETTIVSVDFVNYLDVEITNITASLTMIKLS